MYIRNSKIRYMYSVEMFELKPSFVLFTLQKSLKSKFQSQSDNTTFLLQYQNSKFNSRSLKNIFA